MRRERALRASARADTQSEALSLAREIVSEAGGAQIAVYEGGERRNSRIIEVDPKQT